MKTQLEFATTANRRVYEVRVNERRYEWSNKKLHGTIEINIRWQESGYKKHATLDATLLQDGTFDIKPWRGTRDIAPSSLAKLTANIKAEIEKVEHASIINELL